MGRRTLVGNNRFRMHEVTRREVIKRCCLGGGLGASAMHAVTGCRNAVDVDSPACCSGTACARVDIVEVDHSSPENLAELRAIIGRELAAGIVNRGVLIQSSYLGRHPARFLRKYLHALGFVADMFSDLGASDVKLCTEASVDQLNYAAFTVTDSAISIQGRQPLYCATRLSGRLRFEVPAPVVSAGIIVSAPFSDFNGVPLLSCINLLGLTEEHARVLPSSEQLAGVAGDLAIDVAATIKPQYSMNFASKPGAADGRLKVVMSRELSAADAVTCFENAVNPDRVAPLRHLPAWLGPISHERIRVFRHNFA
jgi:hypothetical protein